MPGVLPSIRVGQPVHFQSVSVFPLFSEPQDRIDYQLAEDAIADQSLGVEEVSESGSVPELLVENKGDRLVLFIEGEELVGAKQNRILNTTVLVAGNSTVRIPVSCVEQGRWAYRSRHFKSSGSHTPSKLRYALKRSVSQSVKDQGAHGSNQMEIWGCVESMLSDHKVRSNTSAMSEAFQAKSGETTNYRKNLRYVSEATGLAVAIGKRVVSCDLFDKPATCEKVWDRLLSGCVLDSMRSDPEEGRAELADVERILQAANAAHWDHVKPVGEGEEFRAEFQEDHASALTFQNTVVHGSVVSV